MPLAHADLTEKIIGAAIAVQKELGPGFIESIYENAMMVELGRRGIPADRQVEIAVYYAGVEVGKHRLDLLVNNSIVVELKAVKHLEDIHFAITRSYLKAANLEHGLLLNFASVPLEIKRVIRSKE